MSEFGPGVEQGNNLVSTDGCRNTRIKSTSLCNVIVIT